MSISSASSQARSLRCAILIGIGMMAAIDEIVFHQLLAWHHFVDGRSNAFALFSDGLLHTGELLFLVAGSWQAATLLKAQLLVRPYFVSGLLIGAGGFQLFDGIVDHKILRLHQVRYVDNLWLYDLGWNAAGLAILLFGLWLWRRAARQTD